MKSPLRMIETVFEAAGALSIVLVVFGVPTLVVLCAGLQYPTMLAGEDLGPDVGDAPLGTFQMTAEAPGMGDDAKDQEADAAAPGEGDATVADGGPGGPASGEAGAPANTLSSPNGKPTQSGKGATFRTYSKMGNGGGRSGSTEGATGKRDQAKQERRGSSCKKDPGVTKVAPTTWSLSREFVDTNADASKLQARLDWHETNGKRDGFVISQIGCGALRQMELRNGDVVHAINGKRVRTLTKAFFVWRSVKKQTAVRIELTRQGARRTHTYLVN